MSISLRITTAFLISIIGLSSCQSPISNEKKAKQEITTSIIKKHIAVLANDSSLGRKPFTEGGKKTIQYISNQYKQLGLTPANEGSYLQQVPMVEIDSKPSNTMQITGGKKGLSFQYEKDFVAISRQEVPEINIVKAPLVFVGFGVVAPEYHWNDYKGIDVKGKVVVVLVNDPGFRSGQPDLFKGDTMTYYGRWTYKYAEAARQGAAGILIVHQTKPASYPWSVVQGGWSGGQLYLKDPNKHSNRCKMEGWISDDAAKRLFANAGITADFTEMARKRNFKAIPLHQKISVSLTNKIKYNVSYNVAGLLKGTKKPAEYIIYAGHWDHFGIGLPVNGDSIYNGAIDNASGIASMLAIAKAFKSLPTPPKRSILFLGTTAEEQGLLGSKYYAKHPIFPLNKTVGDINLDAMGNYGKTRDIEVTGLGQNHLEDYVYNIAKRDSLTVKGDINPSSGGYFRSDHFSFARVGVPAIDVHNGIKSFDTTQESKEQLKKLRAEGERSYHQPFDEYDSIKNFRGMVQVSQLLFEVGYQLAQEDTFPTWKSGSEFKSIREKTMQQGNSNK